MTGSMRWRAVWAAADPARPGEVIRARSGVQSLAVADGPSGLIVTGHGDGTVRIWTRDGVPHPAATGQGEVGLLGRHDGGVGSVAVAFDPATGELVVVSGGDLSGDQSVRAWMLGGDPYPGATGQGEVGPNST